MKKLLTAFLCCVVALVLIACVTLLTGCAQVIDTEAKVVQATITEVDKDPVRITRVGKVTVSHPADYDICLKYEDIETWIDVTRSEYDKYESLVGTTIEAMLVTDYYDDNTTKQYLKLMGE